MQKDNSNQNSDLKQEISDSNQEKDFNHKINNFNQNKDFNNRISNYNQEMGFNNKSNDFKQENDLKNDSYSNKNINPFKQKDDDFDKALDKNYLDEYNNQYYYSISQCNSLDNSSQGRLVSNILLNLIESLENYLLKIARFDYINSYFDWDFHLLNSSFANAFCMPGGKVLVYSGILSIADSEERIAYILAHEMAHALLNHPRDYIFVKDSEYNNVLLFKPFSLNQEFEADRLAMMILKWADYDIGNVPSFCQSLRGSYNKFNYFSTHPLSDDRIMNMESLIAEINNLEEDCIEPIIKNDRSNGNFYKKRYGLQHKNNNKDADNEIEDKPKVFCNNCGYYEDSDSTFCSNCGSRLDDKSRCDRCGALIDPSDLFCTNCGNVLVEDYKCFNCGKKIKPGDVFCVNCGIKLIR